jgi:hypothetical protein
MFTRVVLTSLSFATCGLEEELGNRAANRNIDGRRRNLQKKEKVQQVDEAYKASLKAIPDTSAADACGGMWK